jgi:hypothetical protein
MLSKLLNRTCVLTLRSASEDKDDYGNERPSETTVTVLCELQQQQRTEQDLAGETSDTHWLLILPPGTQIGTGDSAEVDGHEYEVVGEPWKARNPRTQAQSHVEATLRRVAGSEDAS